MKTKPLALAAVFCTIAAAGAGCSADKNEPPQGGVGGANVSAPPTATPSTSSSPSSSTQAIASPTSDPIATRKAVGAAETYLKCIKTNDPRTYPYPGYNWKSCMAMTTGPLRDYWDKVAPKLSAGPDSAGVAASWKDAVATNTTKIYSQYGDSTVVHDGNDLFLVTTYYHVITHVGTNGDTPDGDSGKVPSTLTIRKVGDKYLVADDRLS